MIDAHRVTLAAEDDFDGWRDAARGLAEAGVPAAGDRLAGRGRRRRPVRRSRHQPAAAGPELRRAARLRRPGQEGDLPFATPSASPCSTRCCSSCAPTAARWRTAPTPCSTGSSGMAKEVRRDVHKMHAFVRFREVEEPGGRRASSPSSSPTITSSATPRASSCAASPTCAGRS